MKITKEYLKKLVREAVEEEMGSEGESGSGLLDKLKKRLKTMEGTDESGYGSWNKDEDEWYYDDAEGGYYNEATVNWKDPQTIKVSASTGGYGSETQTFDLKSETDIDDIIKFIEEVAGLSETQRGGSGEKYITHDFEAGDAESWKPEPEEEDEGMLKESVKRRFARLANIKRKKLREAMEEEPESLPAVDYGFGTKKRGVWVTVDDGGKLFVQFAGRVPAEKFFGQELKPQDFQLQKDGDSHQISENPMFRPSGDPLKSAQEERYRTVQKGSKK